MAQTPPGQASQIEMLVQMEIGRRPPGNPIRHFRCSRCQIIYSYVADPGGKQIDPKCPLCKAELTTEQMRSSLQNLTNKVALLEQQHDELDGQVNLQRSMKDALEFLGDEDRMFLKMALYQWRQDRSVTLKTTHNTDGKVTGFLADYRHSEPQAHTCTSIGGVAVAGIYEEAMRSIGSAKAIEVFVRSAQHLLPGGL